MSRTDEKTIRALATQLAQLADASVTAFPLGAPPPLTPIASAPVSPKASILTASPMAPFLALLPKRESQCHVVSDGHVLHRRLTAVENTRRSLHQLLLGPISHQTNATSSSGAPPSNGWRHDPLTVSAVHPEDDDDVPDTAADLVSPRVIVEWAAASAPAVSSGVPPIVPTSERVRRRSLLGSTITVLSFIRSVQRDARAECFLMNV